MPGGITLIAPIGLLGLLAVAAIVIIHMRQRTPPRITLPSLRFWDPVDSERAQKRRLQLPPITLPFVLQLLAAAAIALALAKPAMNAIPGLASQRTEPAQTIVLVDGSTSMLALAEEGDARTRWDLARNDAIEVVDDWQAGDVVTVLVVGNQVESWSASTQPQAVQLRTSLRNMRAPGGTADFDAALRLAANLIVSDRDSRVLVITDGAISVDPATSADVPAPIALRIVGEQDDTLPNVAVTAIGSRSVVGQDDTYRLSFAISSFAETPVRLAYRVQADGVDVVASELDLAAGETRPVEVTLPPGATSSEVIIDVRDLFMADNSAQVILSQDQGSSMDILLISDNPTILERALGALPSAVVDTFATSTPGIQSLAAAYDLVVFHGVSPDPADMPNSPMLFLRPTPLDDRFTTVGVMPNPNIDQFDASSPILDGVDLAGVTFGNTPLYTLSNGETSLVTGSANGLTGPLIWTGEINEQPYVTLGFDLETSNITQRVAFPILIARSVSTLVTPPGSNLLALGDAIAFDPNPATSQVNITVPDDSVTELAMTDEAPISFADTTRPGLYLVEELDANGQVRESAHYVVNTGSLAESDLRPRDGLLSALVGGDTSNLDAGNTGALSDLWPLLVAVALLVIAAEWMIARFGALRLAKLRTWRPAMPRRSST